MSGYTLTLSLLSLALLPILPVNSQTVSITNKEFTKEKVDYLTIHDSDNKLKTSQASTPFDLHNQQVAQGTSAKTWEGTLDENSEVINDDTVSPEDEKIAENNNGGTGNNATITVTLPITGTYTVIINTVEKEKKGNYILSLREGTAQELELAKAEQLNQQVVRLYRQGKYQEAIPLAEQTLEIRKNILGDSHPDVAQSLNNLAELYRAMGRYEEALPRFQDALTMRKKHLGDSHPDVATSLNNLAGLYRAMGRYEESLPRYQDALAMRKKHLGDSHPDVATSLNNLAALYESMGRYEEALPRYQDALAMLKKLLGDSHPNVATALNNLAGLYLAQGNSSSAFQLRSESLNIEEFNLTKHLIVGSEANKLQYMATLSRSTNGAISWHLNHSPDNPLAARQALTTLLRRKGRILDLLTQNQQILRQQLEPENRPLLDKLVALNTQLTNLIYAKPGPVDSTEERQQQIDKLTRETQQLEAELSRLSTTFRVETESVTLETIQALIPENTVLIEIVRYQTHDPKASGNEKWGDYRYGAYLLRSIGEPMGIDLGDAATIEDEIENFRLKLAQDIPLEQTKARGQILEELVFAKIRDFLKQGEHLLISPDGQLNLIPFEALVDENDNYLVENYRFTYLSSGRDLIRLAAHTPSMAPPVLLGNPNFVLPGVATRGDSRYSPLTNLSWPKLPGTAEEIAEIATLFENEVVFMQQEASESNLKQVQRPSILHLATHGFFVDTKEFSNPLAAAGLALAGTQERQGGETENGLFTALEAVNLDLVGTQLIVLSACDTGLGSLAAGEGIYGLRRAFVIAGSQTQIISLWKVDDEGTKDLMVAYYRKLLEEKKGRSQGLRELQLEMINGEKGDNYRHPYYWSSFILSGDSSGVKF